MSEHTACPFCENELIDVVSPGSYHEYEEVYAFCGQCDARGPVIQHKRGNDVAASQAEAITAWNSRGATPSRESSDELAALAAKYLGMDLVTFRDSTGYAEGYSDECEAILADIKRLAGSVVSQARGDK